MLNPPKTFVLDTNVILHDPVNVWSAFGDNRLVIPLRAIEELDRLKSVESRISWSAREASRQLEALLDGCDFSKGVKTPSGGNIRVEIENRNFGNNGSVLANTADNVIIFLVKKLADANKEQQVILVTKDINMRLKARSMGLKAEDFESDKTAEIDELPSGFMSVTVNDNAIRLIHQKGFVNVSEAGFSESLFKHLYPNMCLELIGETNKTTALAIFKDTTKTLRLVPKPPMADRKGKIYPKNSEQSFAISLVSDPAIDLVALWGPAGTGKTLMALLAGYKMLMSKEFQKIIVFRPTKEVGDPLGFLPGTIDEKFSPWTRPIISNMNLVMNGKEERKVSDKAKGQLPNLHLSVDDLLKDKRLEILPVNYVRGDTLNYSFVIFDEAQNFSLHDVKTAITRAGSGTKMVLTGDLAQVDGNYLDSRSNGLAKAISVFNGQEIFGNLKLKIGVRSNLANIASGIL